MVFEQDKTDKILSTLASFEARAVYFLTLNETSRLLGMSEYEVRYSIMAYRLDAFLFWDGYRIAIASIREFILGDTRDEYYAFINLMRKYEIEGVYDLNFNMNATPLLNSLERLRLSYDVVLPLLNKDTKQNYYDIDKRCVLEDIYDLGTIAPWPYKALIGDYAKILKVNANNLAANIGIKDSLKIIEWPEMYDFLVGQEFANMNIPYELKERKQNTELFSQPELF